MEKVIFDIETTSLTPVDGRILCISVCNINNDNITSFYGENETNILEQFWNVIKNTKTLLGFMCDTFDWQFILARSLFNNVIVSNYEVDIIDIRKIIYPHNRYMKGTLRNFADNILFIPKTQNGSMMKELYEKKDWKEIVSHCEEDILMVSELLKKMKFCGLIK